MATTTTTTVTESLAERYEVPTPGGPDIIYHPDEVKYKARTERRLKEDPSLPTTPLPAGFPTKLESPLVWEGKDYEEKGEKEWTYDLNAQELEEIDDALKSFTASGKPRGLISPATFPLPKLGPVLRSLSKELYSGRGFFVLRTLPVDKYTRDEIVTVYAGVSSYVGNLRAVQDANAGVLAHIKDLSQTHPAKTIGAPAYTSDKQVFHTDVGDVISLLALETAAEGGRSRIASTWKVYNELAATRPDLIKTLSEPWPFDGYGKEFPFQWRPVLFYHDNKSIIQYARRSFTGFLGLPRTPGIPHITEAQAEALDALHYLGEKHNLGLDFKKGDIQYINNLSVFHARDAFRDDEKNTRHLVRLWLRDEENAWKIPGELEDLWNKLYYTAKPEDQRFPLEPYIRHASHGNVDEEKKEEK
ncbi:hypothetical protein DL96DRAFT_1670168 [Flagelloscypha sp. PMI_526]|nr:hypothetical protein DL96DRAFT_1670168 [Flagelloscypha sp. PMI_526]